VPKDKLTNSYCSPNTMMNILQKRAGYVLSMGENRTVYTVLIRQHTTKILLEDLDIEKII
jgi:hypothetical protein